MNLTCINSEPRTCHLLIGGVGQEEKKTDAPTKLFLPSCDLAFKLYAVAHSVTRRQRQEDRECSREEDDRELGSELKQAH